MTKKNYSVPGSTSVPRSCSNLQVPQKQHFFSKELPFHRTDFRVGTSLNTLILNSSRQESFVIFLPYPHEPHFLSP